MNMDIKRRMAMLQEAERMKRKEHALSDVERQGGEALSKAKTRGSIGSALGGLAGNKLGSMAMSGLLGALTGGVINPLTLQMLTGVGSTLGAGLLAGGVGRLSMGKGPQIKANSDFADVNIAAQDTRSGLQDQYNAQAMKYGINAAKAAALSSAGSAYKGQVKGMNYDSLKGSGVSRYDYDNLLRKSYGDTMMNQADYDNLVKARQSIWKNQGGHLLDDPWA
jgi:hypothetical protein